MKLQTLFKTSQRIHSSEESGVTPLDLRFKFFGLADRLNLVMFRDNSGVFYTDDGTGEMSFGEVEKAAWFRFEPHNFKDAALKIYKEQYEES